MIDIQSGTVAGRFAIESVGVTALKYPIAVRDTGSSDVQFTTARWHMGVALPAERRGTHMSRFVSALEARVAAGQPFDLDGHYRFAMEMTATLDAASADISVDFTWFRLVKAPVSGLAARLESDASFLARTGAEPSKTLTVRVAAKALCPCSKAVSDRGAHNQRSDIRLTVRLAPDVRGPSINELLAVAEASASSPVYPLLKREDEKYVTETAYDNPVFVEDIVRNAAERLVRLPDLLGFAVEAVNRESIHAHDAFARIVHGRP